MKIAVIGSGNVGSALGVRLAKKKHEIVFGTRDPNSPKIKTLLRSASNGASACDIKRAVERSEVIILAAPWTAAKEIIESVGNLKGKILIDCTNPLEKDFSGLTVGHTTSAGEEIARWAKGSHVVKAFNTTGSKNMQNPSYGSERPVMFIAGDDKRSKEIVGKIVEDVGFEPIDTGPLKNSRYLEALAMLWISMAFAGGHGTDFAFKLLRK